MAKNRLGQGIDALLQGDDVEETVEAGSVRDAAIGDIVTNPEQPRKHFSEAALAELADSIREKGVIQPLLVEEQPDGTLQIVAGERRYRASRLAGMETVPVIIRNFSADEKLEIALIENIQREDLSAIEEAKAYKSLMETSGMNQEGLARRLGKNRSTIANAVRLLRLPPQVQHAIDSSELSAGHARALLQAGSEDKLLELFARIQQEGLSVRYAEALARGEELPGAAAAGAGTAAEGGSGTGGSPAPDSRSKKPARDQEPNLDVRKTIELMTLEEKLIMKLGTKVIINGSEDKGKIEITYYSMDDLNRLLDIIAPEESG